MVSLQSDPRETSLGSPVIKNKPVHDSKYASPTFILLLTPRGRGQSCLFKSEYIQDVETLNFYGWKNQSWKLLGGMLPPFCRGRDRSGREEACSKKQSLMQTSRASLQGVIGSCAHRVLPLSSVPTPPPWEFHNCLPLGQWAISFTPLLTIPFSDNA